VTIGGEFIANGSFRAFVNERVDEFVTRIFNKAKNEMLSSAKTYSDYNKVVRMFGDYALRGIKLVHQDGSKQIIDLKKFRLTADYRYNPYLRDGDVIIFPPLDMERSFIEVEGAVNKPGKFQFIDGDKLSDALLFARGVNESYDDIKYAVIERLSYNGQESRTIRIPVDSLNFVLKRGDRIRIVADETNRRDYKVLVLGEVYRPGYIFISKDNTTLWEVINKAGGFRENADLLNAELIRDPFAFANYGIYSSLYKDRDRTFRVNLLSTNIDLLLMERMADVDPQDSLNFIADNLLRNLHAIASIDFRDLKNPNSPSSTFIVKDGDVIIIPTKSDMIYVYGQVMTPGYIKYKPGADYKYYIAQAGGLGKRAKEKVYLIKSKSRAWIDMTDGKNNYKIESGDFIWVPRTPYRDFDYYLKRISTYTTIIGNITSLLLLIYQITR